MTEKSSTAEATPAKKTTRSRTKQPVEAKLLQVRIGANFGATLQVAEWNYAKPSVSADMSFDGIPTDKQIDDAWKFMWDNCIEPQLQDLIESVKARVRELPRNIPTAESEARDDNWGEPKPGRPVESIPDAPAGTVYE